MATASVKIIDSKGNNTNVMTKEQGEKIHEQLVELNYQLGKLIAIFQENLNEEEG